MGNFYHSILVAISNDNIRSLIALLSLLSDKEIQSLYYEYKTRIIEQDNPMIFNLFLKRIEDKDEYDFLIDVINHCAEEDSIKIAKFVMNSLNRRAKMIVLKYRAIKKHSNKTARYLENLESRLYMTEVFKRVYKKVV